MAKLKRSLGLAQCTLMAVGVMLGAGIYALVGKATMLAGNGVWISFLVSGCVAACTGLSYAELSSFISKAGGAYYYASRAFGSLLAFMVSWLLVIGIAIAASAVALGFSGYLNSLVNVDPIWSACLLVIASSALLIYGIEQSALVAGICTALEVIGLAVVIAVGLPKIGTIDYMEFGPSGATGVLAAGALIFFAYIGFEEIAQLSEETVDATRVIPLAVVLSILITTVLYVLVAVAAVSVVPWQQLGSSKSPLADVVAVSLGRQAFVGLSVIALFSTGNTVLILVMSAARLIYGMAEDGKMPRSLAAIHETRQSPYVSTVVVAVAAVLMIVALKDIAVVANVTNFAFLAAFLIVNAAVIALRFREPDTHRPFKIPGSIIGVPLIPVVGILASLFLLTYVGVVAILIGVALAVLGLVLYLLPRRRLEAE